MSDSAFEPLPINTSVQNLISIVDDSGTTKFANDQVSSFNFDGVIPRYTESIPVSDITVGMKFIPDDVDGVLYQIIEIITDDPDFVDVPSNFYTIVYKDSNNETQEITLEGTDELVVQYESWEDKILGTSGWVITSEGNAIFSNIAARGRIEAQEGFLENLDINGSLNIVSGGSINVGENIVIDEFGIRGSDGVYETFNLDSDGNLTLFGTINGATISGDVIFENSNGLGGIGQIATNEDVLSNGGIYMDDTGLYAYNTSGEPTFSIDAETGDVEIFGYASEATTASALGILEDEIDALYDEGFLTDEDLSDTGSTIISGNRITTGVINANLVNISSGLTGARGVKINSLGLFAYNSSGQQTFRINSQTGAVTIGAGADIEGYYSESDFDPANFVEFPDLDSYATYAALSNAGQTVINGGNITTGVIDSFNYNGTGDPVNGTSFSTAGMAINISTGAIITPNFRMSSSGDAEFRGRITAGRGTFTGEAPGTVDGLTRVRYSPSGFWITAETPTIEITRNAGLNSTGYLSIYRPASTSSNSAVGIALFSQGGSGEGDSSSEAVMRGAIEYGASSADGFETGGLLRMIAMPSKSGATPAKVKIQAAGATGTTKVQLSATNLVLTNAKDGQYNPGIQVVDGASTALLGIRTTDGVVSLGPRISYGTGDASSATSGWSPGPKNGDLHFQF